VRCHLSIRVQTVNNRSQGEVMARLEPSDRLRHHDWMNSQRALQIAKSAGPVQVVGHEPIVNVKDVASDGRALPTTWIQDGLSRRDIYLTHEKGPA